MISNSPIAKPLVLNFMETVLPVIEWGAVGVRSTGPLDTGVTTGVVTELTIFDVDTVIVNSTLQDRYTYT